MVVGEVVVVTEDVGEVAVVWLIADVDATLVEVVRAHVGGVVQFPE